MPVSKIKKIVYFLYYPLLYDGRNLYFRDRANVRTIEACVNIVHCECQIVARTRKCEQNSLWVKLIDTPAQLKLALPDYGAHGMLGWINLIRYLSPFLYYRLWRILKNADIVYVEGPSLESYLVSFFRLFLKFVIVLEMRAEMVLNKTYMFSRFGALGLIYRFILSSMFARTRKTSDACLYINQSCRNLYPVQGSLMEAISDAEIPNELFNFSRLNNECFTRFLYVGNLEKVKQVDQILSVLNSIKLKSSHNFSLDIVGDGPQEIQLKENAAMLGLDKIVQFHGRLAWGQPVFEFYKKCDIMLINSCTETGPRVLLEAMAAGIPVICTRVGLAEELLDDCCLVSVGNLHELESKLINLTNNFDLRLAQSIKNRKRVSDFMANNSSELRIDFWRRAFQISQT